jgi:predicted RNA-binding Zn ribbon-like protein
LDFVNSQFTDHLGSGAVYDRLEFPEWWSWLLERWDLGKWPAPTATEIRRLRTLRALVRRLLEAGGPPSKRDVTALNRVLAESPMLWKARATLAGPEIALAPTAGGQAHVRAAIVTSLLELLSGRARQRVRRCGNPDCSFIFNDRSHNGTRRWCDPLMCGNVVKVRAFRAARAGSHR